MGQESQCRRSRWGQVSQEEKRRLSRHLLVSLTHDAIPPAVASLVGCRQGSVQESVELFHEHGGGYAPPTRVQVAAGTALHYVGDDHDGIGWKQFEIAA